MADNEPSKIIIDDDWKNQAQIEKEKLSKQVEDQKKAQQEAEPPLALIDLIYMFIQRYTMAMGGYVNKQTGKPIVNVTVARQSIEALCVLLERTAGNLSNEEAEVLQTAIQRMTAEYIQFMEILKQQGTDGLNTEPLAEGAEISINPEFAAVHEAIQNKTIETDTPPSADGKITS